MDTAITKRAMATALPAPTPLRKSLAWGVHAYTALGLPLSLAATWALAENRPRLFFFLLAVAVFVDSTDGTLARAVRVRDVLPEFDGRRLDDLIDFLTFAFLPVLAMPALGLLPEGYWWTAAFPLLASGYGFCQERAKTDDAFVGFPSYWNVLVFYLWILGSPPWLNLAIIEILAVLVFVPVHYVYPTKTKLLMPLTLVLSVLWGLVLMLLTVVPTAVWSRPVAYLTLLFPAYYLVVSLVHHVRVHRKAAAT